MSEAHPYVPELGQAAFGQPWKDFACRPHVTAALAMIRDELDRVMENALQKDYPSPFGRYANTFACDSFQVHGYSWSDEPQAWNFKWGETEVSWYKAMGRGMSSNVEITPDMAARMLEECLADLDCFEDEERRYDPAFVSAFEQAVRAADGWNVVAPTAPVIRPSPDSDQG